MQEKFNTLYALYRVQYDSLVALTDYPLIANRLRRGEDPLATKRDVYESVLTIMKPYAEFTRPLNVVDIENLLESAEREALLSKQIEAIGYSNMSTYEGVIKATEWAEALLRLTILLHQFNGSGALYSL